VFCIMARNSPAACTFFSVSFVVSDAASPLSPARVSPWGVAVVFGFVYSLVDSFFLLAGLTSIVSSV